jgi:hypothetical protein
MKIASPSLNSSATNTVPFSSFSSASLTDSSANSTPTMPFILFKISVAFILLNIILYY